MMSDIDERIRGSLDADDKAFLARLEDDRGLWRQAGDSLSGPMGGWAKLVAFMSLALAAAIVVAIWQLLTATDTRELVLWAVATIGLMLAQGFAKDWFFSRMNMLAILREVKRLQVQVALLDGENPRA
jgi:hypothetical protein